MGITKDSTLSQVFEESKKSFTPTSSDVGEWTKLTPATGDAVVTTKVGLLGVDLTDFLDNCAKATKACHVPDYDEFTGWAIGVEWTAASAPSPSFSGVAFEDKKILVANSWDTPNELISGTFFVDVAVDKPGFGDITSDRFQFSDNSVMMDPFITWFGEMKPLADKLQYAIHF